MDLPIIGLVGLGLLVVVSYFGLKRCMNEQCRTDYRNIFHMGVVLFFIGLNLMMSGGVGYNMIIILGFMYMVGGLANKNKWSQPKYIESTN